MRYRRLAAGAGRSIEVCFTDRHDGDFRVDQPGEALTELRRGVFEGEWTWLRQVHGGRVVMVDEPGQWAGEEADAAVTDRVGAVLCVQTADCVPVVLVGSDIVGVVHAGWRGLVAGVVESTAKAMTTKRDGPLSAIIGPHIGAQSYEFGEDDLAAVEAALDGVCRSSTSDGRPALDLALAVRLALRGCGVETIEDLGMDTTDDRFFSHRVRGDLGRQTSAARIVEN